MRLVAIAIAVCAGTATASTVLELGPVALEVGADLVVEGTVVSRTSRWTGDRSAIETHAVIAIEATHKGAPAATVEVVVAGGAIEGAQQIVFGMPSVGVGERARWFLKSRGDGTYRVYGWGQGKWPARQVAGRTRFVRAPVAAERDPGIALFATNGMVWPAAKQPVQYVIQNAGSDDMPIEQVIATFDAAFATWQNVPTASLAFVNAGMTELGIAVDGTNVMLFVESGWTFGSEAAAATSLFIIDGQQTADIAVNGQHFQWRYGPSNSAVTFNILDLQAVLTHEIGHFSGLGHTDRAYDTMYFTWKPWQGQRTLSIDDKLGLSSIYPTTGSECAITATCDLPAGEECVEHPLGRLCEGKPDPIGAPCNYDRVECDAFCLFTQANLASGYCSRFCEQDSDCPLTHHCDEASAGSMTVKVCFEGAQPPPPPPCASDDACPAGQHCGDGACTFECRTPDDCGSGSTCDARGFCVAVEEGGCRIGGDPPSVLWLLGGLLLLLASRRR